MAIGVEFETDVKVTGDVEYQKVIYQAADMGWKILLDGVEGDNAVLEFVTVPFSEAEEITAATDQMLEFITLILDDFDGQDRVFSDIIAALAARDGKWASTLDAYGGIVQVRKRDFAGAPQVTLDIPLEQVNGFLGFAQGLPVATIRQALDRKITKELKAKYGAQAQPYKSAWDTAKQNLADLDERSPDYQAKRAIYRDTIRTAREAVAAIQGEYETEYLEIRTLVNQSGTRVEGLKRVYYGDKLFVDPTVLFPGADILNTVGKAEDWVAAKRTDHGTTISDEGYNKACGLMTLLLLYLNCGFAVSAAQDYSKEYFTVMSRTCFSAMYAALDDNVQALFSTDEVIITAWGGEESQKNNRVLLKGFAETEIKIGTSTYPVADGDGGAKLAFGPKRGEWVDSVLAPPSNSAAAGISSGLNYIRGSGTYVATVAQCDAANANTNPTRNFHFPSKDLMSRGDAAYNSISLGYNHNLGDGGSVALEFRQWPKVSLPPAAWWGFTNSIYESTLSYLAGD
ncbi:hypothetical protein [Kordiimonas sp.]|uniref:hypothetical protein n=1 Tax=Kordiimonas sp. TaxID=1970157 RepID=UPI003A8D11AB